MNNLRCGTLCLLSSLVATARRLTAVCRSRCALCRGRSGDGNRDGFSQNVQTGFAQQLRVLFVSDPDNGQFD